MPEARSPDNTRRNPLPPLHDLSNALRRDASARGKSFNATGKRELKAEKHNRIGSLLLQLANKGILEINFSSMRYKFTISFLAKLVDAIVSLREWIRDKKAPTLHIAILSTVIEFYGGIHSQEVSEAVALIEEMISDDIEFQILNK